MKDNFSTQSNQYAQFRPQYPSALYDFIIALMKNKMPTGLTSAWDCGTGNGQVAKELAHHFKKVYATDISAKQLEKAVRKDNIAYSVEPAETTSFPDSSIDLITVAQAIHWFDFEKFYSEVNRVLKPNGVLAVIGYGLHSIDATVDPIVFNFYQNIVGPYWDAERRYIEEGYQTIPFPFQEIKSPQLSIEVEWNVQQLLGYLESWSAVQHYIRKNNSNPLELIEQELKAAWPQDEIRKAKFPLLLRIGTKIGSR